MDIDKIEKLAIEMLLELTEEETLEARLLKQRLKTVLVWKSIKTQDFLDEERASALQYIY
jgi:hypothetical protein